MSHDVTETKSLQGLYNLLFERVPCYVAVINRDLRIVRANEMLRETFGERSGVHCYEALKQSAEPCPDCPAIKTFDDGQPNQSKQVGTDKNGQLKHYVVSTTPLARSGKEFDHIIEMSTDVTDVHKLSEHLRRESSFRQILIDNTLEALIAADTTGVVTVFNQAAEDLFGESAARAIGRLEGNRFWPREFASAIAQGKSSAFDSRDRGHQLPGGGDPGAVFRLGAARRWRDHRLGRLLPGPAGDSSGWSRRSWTTSGWPRWGRPWPSWPTASRTSSTDCRAGCTSSSPGCAPGSQQRVDAGLGDARAQRRPHHGCW